MKPLPRWCLRPLALALVCACAKVLLVALRFSDGAGGGLVSGWTPLALFDQDIAVALGFAVVEVSLFAVARRAPAASRALSHVAFAAYLGAVVYVAINVPIARVASTPLTAGMIAATRAELKDSILPFFTPTNLGAVLGLVTLSLILPRKLARTRRPGPRRLVALAAGVLCVAASGPTARAHVDSLGLHRNALVAWVASSANSDGAPGAAIAPLPREGEALDLRHFAAAAKGKNVVWVVLESAGARYLKPWGAERDPMPRLTQLASRGVVFEHAYATYPMSIPGLFAALCSRAPAPYAKVEALSGEQAPCPSIAERFGAAGYATSLVHSGRFVYLGMRGVVEKRGFDQLVDAEDIPSRFSSSFGVDEHAAVKRALEVVDGTPRDKPFFLMYLPIAGHHPYRAPGDAPRPFGTKEPIDAYASDLSIADSALGELVDGIAARGKERETLWVVVGDHGEAFYQHEGNFGHAMFAHEENVHVPLLIAAPGLLDEARRAPQLASVVDLAPTLLDLVGSPIPEAYEGRSLLNPDPGTAQFFADQVVLQLGLRIGPWKLLDEPSSGRTKLFDLRTDPGELEDVSSREPERVRRYRDHVRAWAARTR